MRARCVDFAREADTTSRRIEHLVAPQKFVPLLALGPGVAAIVLAGMLGATVGSSRVAARPRRTNAPPICFSSTLADVGDEESPLEAKRSPVATIIAGSFLAASALLCGLVTRSGLEFAHEVTCGGEPPVAWRTSVVYWGLGFYLAALIPALVVLIRFRKYGPFIAGFLAFAGMGISILTFLIPLFAAALC